MQDSYVHKGKRKILVEYLREKIGISDDNVLKAIKDGLNGVAWKDDSQVCVLRECRKGYSDTPRVLVTVEEIA